MLLKQVSVYGETIHRAVCTQTLNKLILFHSILLAHGVSPLQY